MTAFLVNTPAARAVTPQTTSVTAPSTTVTMTPQVRRRKALLRFAMSITALNVLGYTVLGFEQPVYVPIVSVLTSYAAALLFETVDSWAHRRRAEYRGGGGNLFYFLLPSHIAPLATSMLLYADNTGPYLFAVIAAAASKYLFRVQMNGRLRHFLNPSNFGIALTLLLIPTVGFAPPYMFLNNIDQPWDWLLPAGILMLGTMLNANLTNKMPLIFAWVGGFIAQAVLRWLLLGDNPWAIFAVMTGVPFVLYTNYMISDPGTTPFTRRGQIGFGLTLSVVYGLLIISGVSYAIFFALIIVCILRGLLMFRSKVTFARRGGVTLQAVNHG